MLNLMLNLLLILSLLTGCSKSFDSVLPDRRPDYRQSRLTPPLEVPPDLTSSTIDDALAVPEINPAGSARLSAYAGERTGPQLHAKSGEAVLPPVVGVTMQRDGRQHWLVVNAPAEHVWPKVREFWLRSGFALKREDPALGIMETDWLENRADIPEDGIRSILKKYLDVLYSAPSRDKFRTRLERTSENQSTEVYVTHYGVEEVAVGGSGASTSGIYRWQNRPASPELEIEMLHRLRTYLGASEQQAASPSPAAARRGPRVRRVTADGEEQLWVSDDYSRVWRQVGLALDAGHYAVEEQSRNQGLYIVEYHDPEQENQDKGDDGWLAKLAFWRSRSDAPPSGSRYRVRLAGQGKETSIVVRDSHDQPDRSTGARKVLELLEQAIQ